MVKIAFLGAGSTVFARNVVGDCLLAPALAGCEVALHDIDPRRLDESLGILRAMAEGLGSKARVEACADRRAALAGADFVVNAIQVGGYKPSTVIDFEVPKRFGLRQTIGDTIGIGGIFRALRTIPVLEGFARDIEELCPKALFLNYTNPMAILSGYLGRYTGVRAVGLCHSVQVCAQELLEGVGMAYDEGVRYKIAGINHMAWLLEIERDGVDLYPEIKRRSAAMGDGPKDDKVRHQIMRRFGYYVTESSEHNAEYLPYFIKARYPELIERFDIPLDEYPRRCVSQIEGWERTRDELARNPAAGFSRSREYASYIMEAVVEDRPYKIGGNVPNRGLIDNLPREACVEVPCLVDSRGVSPCAVGPLPEQLAALDRTNINPQLLAIEAARTRKRETVYQAALLDPHTSAELSIDDIVALCDALFEAHGPMLPEYS